MDTRKSDLEIYTPELLTTLKAISQLHHLNNDVRREVLFHEIDEEVIFQNLPKYLQEKVSELRKSEARIYREFILMIHNKEIEITPQEIIYRKAKIAIQTQ